MRVVLLTKNFPPRTCGVGDYACRLAQELAAAGDFVNILTEPADGPRQFPFRVREVSLRGWGDLAPVLSEILEAAPDRVLLEYSGYAWGRWGTAWWLNALLFRLRQRGIPVHLGLHELAVSMRQHPVQAPIALAQWLHIGLMVAAAETVSVNMHSRANLLARLFPGWRTRIRYRPNSSTVPFVPLDETGRRAFRRARGVAAAESVVATFGLFHPAKNYEAVIRAVAILREAIPVTLWMLGDFSLASPDYIARLTRAARECGVQDSVWLPGRLDAPEVSRALQSADVFVLPQPDGHLTRSSAFMAAASHGLPVVATRQPGGRDQTEFIQGQHVWFVERSTTEAFAGAIQSLLAGRAASAEMGRNLGRLYTAQFDWRATISAFRGKAASPACSVNGGAKEERGAAPTAAHTGGLHS